MAKKYYTVKQGVMPGVYETWAECQAQTKGFKGAKFKSFPTKELAENALIHGWDTPESKPKTKAKPELNANYIKNSLSVDAACSGNPGAMEYQGVNTATGELLFGSIIYPKGTNNIGEFLAVVSALKYLNQINSDIPIYTDSKTAMAWVRNRRVKTAIKRNPETEVVWLAIDNALEWLHRNDYQSRIIKWNTEEWGESKADFGRK